MWNISECEMYSGQIVKEFRNKNDKSQIISIKNN